MKKVGFVINFNKNSWLGGYNYFYNLFKFYTFAKKKKILPVIITDNEKKVSELVKEFNFQVINSKYFSNSNTSIRILNKLLVFFFNKNFLIEEFLKKNDILAVSHNLSLGRNSGIKSFPWFPDFQEINLPQNFSLKMKLMRKLNIFFAIKHSTKIIISSHGVESDLKKISTKAFEKSKVIKHCIYLPPKKKLLSRNKLLKKYNIKDNYFILPNHYWKHKNHIIVLKALKELKKFNKKLNFKIISSGNFEDRRDKSHSIYIKDFIKKNSLSKNYIILGIIPFEDLIGLIYYSKGLINPSKSEGWSNSVEQAKEMNKRVILSDISIHREQETKNFYFFKPDDHIKLSKHLKDLVKKPIKRDYINSLKSLKKKQTEYYKNYQNFILKYI